MSTPKSEDVNKMIKRITSEKNKVLRYMAGRSFSRYVVKENGIHEEWDELDQNGEVICTIGKIVVPKELFVAAYNAYIKNEKEDLDADKW